MYHQLQVEKLPPPYKTNCKNYPIKTAGVEQSQHDCIAKCVFGDLIRNNHSLFQGIMSLNNYFNINHFSEYFIKSELFQSSKTLNDSLFKNLGRRSLDKISNDLFFKIPECTKHCLVDCHSSTYFLKLINSPPKSNIYYGHLFEFLHDDSYDVYLKHSPLMDWVTFLGILGGLAGMWVGFTFINLPMLLSKLGFQSFKFFKKFTKINFKNVTNRDNLQSLASRFMKLEKIVLAIGIAVALKTTMFFGFVFYWMFQ